MHVYVYSQTAPTMQFSKALNTRVFMQHCVEYIATSYVQNKSLTSSAVRDSGNRLAVTHHAADNEV